MRYAKTLICFLFFLLSPVAGLTNTIKVTELNEWVKLKDEEIKKGIFRFDIENTTKEIIRDFHIEVRDVKIIWEKDIFSFPPFKKATFSQDIGTVHFTDGAIKPGDTAKVLLRLLHNHDDDVKTPRILFEGKTNFRYMATTSGKVTPAPLPGALVLFLTAGGLGLGVRRVSRRATRGRLV